MCIRDRHNIEHLLYYTLSLTSYDNLEQAMKEYTETKNKQLQSFHNDDKTDYTIFSKNILFSSMNETSINDYDKSLVFDVNGDKKYINFAIIRRYLSAIFKGFSTNIRLDNFIYCNTTGAHLYDTILSLVEVCLDFSIKS